MNDEVYILRDDDIDVCVYCQMDKDEKLVCFSCNNPSKRITFETNCNDDYNFLQTNGFL